jgi:hypothetical protein
VSQQQRKTFSLHGTQMPTKQASWNGTDTEQTDITFGFALSPLQSLFLSPSVEKAVCRFFSLETGFLPLPARLVANITMLPLVCDHNFKMGEDMG